MIALSVLSEEEIRAKLRQGNHHDTTSMLTDQACCTRLPRIDGNIVSPAF
jgi:hypothetical protein